MELSEALKIIDTTSGMLHFLLFEVQAGELKDKFLLTPVHKSVETFYDPDINCYKTECREHYTYMSSGEERKAYVVDVSPACDYLLNKWPSPTAKRIRKVMAEVFFNSMDEWKEILGNDIGPALEEGYDYERFFVARGEHPRVLYDVIFDTFHEMIHALGLTDEELFGEGSEEEAPSIPRENDEELFKFIHPSVPSEQERLVHEEVKRLVSRHGIQEICQYLLQMRKQDKILLPQSAEKAYNELVRMGMPNGKRYNIKTFMKYYIKE